MAWERLGASGSELLLMVAATVGIYLTVVVLTRVAGQRSLASFSTFDFAVTVATGAILGRVAMPRISLVAGVGALAVLFGAQAALRLLRHRSDRLSRAIDNPPILVMAGGRILPGQLHRARLGKDDLRERLRLEGIRRYEQVEAAVLERSGALSVIERADRLDQDLFRNVAGAAALEAEFSRG